MFGRKIGPFCGLVALPGSDVSVHFWSVVTDVGFDCVFECRKNGRG